MTPLFSSCCGCSHPAMKAAKQCKHAMTLANEGRHEEAIAMLRHAMRSLRGTQLPMMYAKVFNSLGLVHAQQKQFIQARRCFQSSLRLVERHVGRDNWLHARIAGNYAQVSPGDSGA